MSDSVSSSPRPRKRPCNRCGKPFSPDDFSTIKRKNTVGYYYICKECDSAASAKRYEHRKKQCAYPECTKMIAPGATYCNAHFRLDPEDIARRAAKFPPRSTCVHPDCEIIPARGAIYCRKHAKRMKPTLVTRAKMSASAKIRANTPEGKAILSRNGTTSFKEHTHTEATKAIIRQKRSEQVITPESIEKGRAKLRGRPNLKNRGGKCQKINLNASNTRSSLSKSQRTLCQ